MNGIVWIIGIESVSPGTFMGTLGLTVPHELAHMERYPLYYDSWVEAIQALERIGRQLAQRREYVFQQTRDV